MMEYKLKVAVISVNENYLKFERELNSTIQSIEEKGYILHNIDFQMAKSKYGTTYAALIKYYEQ